MEEQAKQNSFIDELEKALISRDVDRGFFLLDSLVERNSSIDFASSPSLRSLLCLTQWIDLGYRDLTFLEQRMPGLALDRGEMSVLDYLRLNLVESYRSFAAENLDRAISLSGLVLTVGADLLPPHLLFLAHFWKGRVHRKKGEYADALFHITSARVISETAGAPKLTAESKIHESWLVFQKGERKTAFRLLDEAELELNCPDMHSLSEILNLPGVALSVGQENTSTRSSISSRQ